MAADNDSNTPIQCPGDGAENREEPQMRIRADIKCHSCGFVSGELTGSVENGSARVRPDQFTPSPLNTLRPWPVKGEPLRCVRCSGKVYLDDIDQIRERPAIVTEVAVPRAA